MNTLRNIAGTFLVCYASTFLTMAQGNQCPGCVANGLLCPNFTGQQVAQVCADSLPDAITNVAYEVDITFRITDQIAYRAHDTLPGTPFTLGFLQQAGFPITIPITVDIDSARLIDIYGLPDGLFWTCDSAANACFYSLPTSSTACFKICGTPACLRLDTTYTIAIELEYTQDLTNLINAFSGGGGGFPFPLPVPSTQTEREIFYYPLTIRGSAAPLLQLTSSMMNDTIEEGQSVTLTATNGFVQYQWSNNSTYSAITVSPVQTTTYSVTATDIRGCTQTASYTLYVKETEPVDTTASIETMSLRPSIRLYPNPSFDGYVTLESSGKEEGTLHLMTMQGSVLLSEKLLFDLNKKTVSLAALPSGIYIVVIKTNNGFYTDKLMIH